MQAGTPRREDLSIRELAERHGVHRRTVRQALDSALPLPRKTYPGRARPVIEPWAGVIDGGLVEDDARVITGRPVTVGAAFTAEAAHLGALPTRDFKPARLPEARVDGQPIPHACCEPSPRPLRRAARRNFPDEANVPTHADLSAESTRPFDGRSDVTFTSTPGGE